MAREEVQKMSMKEFNSGAGIMFCVLLVLWFCVAGWWKTMEVAKFGFKRLNRMNVQAYYDTMDRMDAAVERFWRAEK